MFLIRASKLFRTCPPADLPRHVGRVSRKGLQDFLEKILLVRRTIKIGIFICLYPTSLVAMLKATFGKIILMLNEFIAVVVVAVAVVDARKGAVRCVVRGIVPDDPGHQAGFQLYTGRRPGTCD